MGEIYELYYEEYCDSYWDDYGDNDDCAEERVGFFSTRADAETVKDLIGDSGIAVRNITTLVVDDVDTFIAENYYFDYSQTVTVEKIKGRYVLDVETDDLYICEKSQRLHGEINITYPHSNYIRITLSCCVAKKHLLTPFQKNFQQGISHARFFIKEVNEVLTRGEAVPLKEIKAALTTIFETRYYFASN